MKRNLAYINLVLMLSVLFAVSYQSIHSFSHEQHLEHDYCKNNPTAEIKKLEKSFTETEDCPVCDFKFVAFVSAKLEPFTFFPPFYKIPYLFNSKEACLSFEGNTYYLRGPPAIV